MFLEQMNTCTQHQNDTEWVAVPGILCGPGRAFTPRPFGLRCCAARGGCPCPVSSRFTASLSAASCPSEQDPFTCPCLSSVCGSAASEARALAAGFLLRTWHPGRTLLHFPRVGSRPVSERPPRAPLCSSRAGSCPRPWQWGREPESPGPAGQGLTVLVRKRLPRCTRTPLPPGELHARRALASLLPGLALGSVLGSLEARTRLTSPPCRGLQAAIQG